MNQFEYIQLQVKLAKFQAAVQNAVIIGEAEEQQEQDKVIKGFGKEE